MFILQGIALLVSALAIITYFHLARTGNAGPFNWVNALGWPILVTSLIAHAWPAAILNLFFTLAGTYGVITGRRTRRKRNELVLELLAINERIANPLISIDNNFGQVADEIFNVHAHGEHGVAIGSVNQRGGITAQNVNHGRQDVGMQVNLRPAGREHPVWS